MSKLIKCNLDELNQAEKVNSNGGLIMYSGVWIAAAYEVADIITSAGENIKKAWENGYEAGKNSVS